MATETILFAHMAETTLALGCTETSGTFNVVDGSAFPAPGTGQYFLVVLENALRQYEIVKIVGRTGNTLTVDTDGRAQEGSVARAFNAGDYIGVRLTAGSIAKIKEEAATAASEAALPIGAYVDFPFEEIEDGYLECNGGEVPRDDYDALFAKIGITYGPGDGSTTFTLPKCSGRVARFWDHGRGIDPDASDRTGGDHVGSTQEDAIKKHRHPTGANTGKATGGASVIDPGTWNSATSPPYNVYTLDYNATGDALYPENYAYTPVAEETRMKNIYVVRCIKWR